MIRACSLTAVLFCIVYMFSGCCGTQEFVCPSDKRPVLVQKCPEKFFEDYAKTIDIHFKGTIDVIEKNKGSTLTKGGIGLTPIRG